MFTARNRVLYNLKNSEGLACLNKQTNKNLPFEPVSESCLKLFKKKKNTEIFIQWVWSGASTSAFVKRKEQLPSWFIWRTRIEKQQLYNNKLGLGGKDGIQRPPIQMITWKSLVCLSLADFIKWGKLCLAKWLFQKGKRSHSSPGLWEQHGRWAYGNGSHHKVFLPETRVLTALITWLFTTLITWFLSVVRK